MNIEMKIIREVAVQADQFLPKAEEFGEKAARAFGRHARAQVTGLESIANSTLKVSDVLDYLKTRTARSDRDSRRGPVRWSVEGLGRDLVEHVETGIKQARDRVCAAAAIDKSSADAQRIYLMLIREFVRQIAAHYEFAAAGGKQNGSRTGSPRPAAQ